MIMAEIRIARETGDGPAHIQTPPPPGAGHPLSKGPGWLACVVRTRVRVSALQAGLGWRCVRFFLRTGLFFDPVLCLSSVGLFDTCGCTSASFSSLVVEMTVVDPDVLDRFGPPPEDIDLSEVFMPTSDALLIALACIAGVSVVVRYLARHIQSAGLEADDYVIVLSLVSYDLSQYQISHFQHRHVSFETSVVVC